MTPSEIKEFAKAIAEEIPEDLDEANIASFVGQCLMAKGTMQRNNQMRHESYAGPLHEKVLAEVKRRIR